MEIVEKNTSEFEPGPHSEVKKISQRTVRGWRRKNQERKTQRIDRPTTCYRCAENYSSNLCKFKFRQSVIRVQRRDTLLKFVDRRQRVRHLSKNYDICRKTSVVRHLSKTSVEEEQGLYGVYTKPEVKKCTVNIQIRSITNTWT